MESEKQELANIDFDWFCVDEWGEIGHFSTAGYKSLPRSVVSYAEDLRLVTDYFLKEAPIMGIPLVDSDLEKEMPGFGKRYLRNYIAMAVRGVYSYDILSHPEPGISYFRVVSPEAPVRMEDLPERIRTIVGRTVLHGSPLRRCSRIPYEDTLWM
jgi:hypothetical protein